MNTFILTNDPDHETLELIRPIYKIFNEVGIKVTTGVFCKMENDGTYLSRHCQQGETDSLENPEYKDFLLEQRSAGHEIAFHGYSQVSNKRNKFLEGLEIYKNIFGEYPYTYIEHGGKKGHHPDGGCKKETLIWKGRDKDSDYYIEDILTEKIKCVWAFHDLINQPYMPPEKEAHTHEDYFYRLNDLKNSPLFFRRYRLFQASTVEKTGDLFIGYTHFGYKGYLFDHHDWEYWADNKHSSPINNILAFLEKNNFKSLTVKDYLNSKNDQHNIF
tara:strand:+ start:135 stop:953 length:819 start_codon:yes stop_codon:yes gene_type:complete